MYATKPDIDTEKNEKKERKKKSPKMLKQLTCLKTGGIALGALGTVLATINVFYAIAIYEDFTAVEHNFVLEAIIGGTSEHVIRLTYVIISILDLLASALLIAGILMVNKPINFTQSISFYFHYW